MNTRENKHTLQNNYASLVYDLAKLECSDEQIRRIVVGAFGTAVRDRIAPLLAMVRSYEELSSTEKVDILYSFVERQEDLSQDDALSKNKAT